MMFLHRILHRRRYYLVRCTLWRQPVLGYDDGIRIFQVFKSDYTPPEGEELVLAKLFDHLISTGVLLKGVGIILKPAWGFSRWNAWRMRRLGIKPGETARLFDLERLAVVVNDFFLSNAKWTPGYLVFVRSSDLMNPLLTLIPGIATLKNPLYHSPEETSSSRPGL